MNEKTITLPSIKGYKATLNYKCKGQLYEIGETYEIDEHPLMCLRGFHYCKNMESVVNYYGYGPKFKVLEVEDIGTIRYVEYDKIVTNKIKILREVPKEEWNFISVNESGNEVIRRVLDRFWAADSLTVEEEFDKNQKLIGAKFDDGFVWKGTERSDMNRQYIAHAIAHANILKKSQLRNRFP